MIGEAINNLRVGPAGRTTGNNLLTQNDSFTNVEGWASIQVWIAATSGISAGAVTFEVSPDRRNWFPLPMSEAAAGAGSAASTVTIAASTARTFVANINAAAFRIRVSTDFEDGSVQALATLSEVAIASSGGASGGGGGGDMTETNARIGATNSAAAGGDTADAPLNGLFKRLLQRITALIGLLPSSLGAKTAANSLAVTLATDGAAVTQLALMAAARTPTTTNVSSSASSVSVLASNTNRRGVSFYNNSTAILYLSFSGTATTANAFVAIPSQGFLLLDQQLITTGAITGIWSAANGSVNVTEFV